MTVLGSVIWEDPEAGTSLQITSSDATAPDDIELLEIAHHLAANPDAALVEVTDPDGNTRQFTISGTARHSRGAATRFLASLEAGGQTKPVTPDDGSEAPDWPESGGEFRKLPVTVDATQTVEATEVDTLEGPVMAQPGDWIVTGVSGERWPIHDERFRSTYEPVGVPWSDAVTDGQFRKLPLVVKAVRVDTDTTVETTSGPTVAQAGAWVITAPDGSQWPIQDDIFRKTYEPVTVMAQTPAGRR